MHHDTVVITSGFYNPIHFGHCNYLREARKLGDILVVIVNNDKQVKLKQSVAFMAEAERLEIVRCMKFVSEAHLAIDEDMSVNRSIEQIRKAARFQDCYFIFANGGDINKQNCREIVTCRRLGIELKFGVGGQKVQSSSDLLKKQPCYYDVTPYDSTFIPVM